MWRDAKGMKTGWPANRVPRTESGSSGRAGGGMSDPTPIAKRKISSKAGLPFDKCDLIFLHMCLCMRTHLHMYMRT